ncbi:MAG: hypothetical protein GY759_08860 [Chloroflexi bacterium]|nr:hypothetical protein [Chloroflexota bacterium]
MITETLSPVATWADAWLDAIASFSHPGRMRRGRRFAERGSIRKLDVRPGEISAKVKDGTHTYDTSIQIEPLDDATWETIIEHMASQALYSARLLSGEIPPEVVEVFEQVGVSLFPEAEALQAGCTCPDWEVPCKHIAGLYYVLAERFEKDPFLLFFLRGRSKEDLLSALRYYRQPRIDAGDSDLEEGYVSPPLAESLNDFYEIGAGLKTVSFNISQPQTPMPQLKRLGPPPFTQLDLVTLLSPIYTAVTESALTWAYQ